MHAVKNVTNYMRASPRLERGLHAHSIRTPTCHKPIPKCHLPGVQAKCAYRPGPPCLKASVLDSVASVQGAQGEATPATFEEKPFSWTKQWYAVALLDALDPKKPHSLKLLGKDLVLWRNTSGTWQCFEDRCSHRQAPLSEGRVLGDTLMCSYHGWQFAEGGRCVDVPQAEGTIGNARACNSTRSCVAYFPTTVKQDLVWVWAEPGPLAAIEAAAQGPTLLPWISEDDITRTPEGAPVILISVGMQRDMPISYEHQMENLADPAHFNFAHHSVAGDRLHESAGTAHVEPITKGEETAAAMFDGAEGLAFLTTMLMGKGRSVEDSIHHIVFPGLFTLFTTNPKDFKGADWELLEIHAVPTEPGRVRLLVRIFLAGHNLPLLPRILPKLVPRWASHLYGLEITDGDTVLLAQQDRITRSETERTGREWSKQYYMPTASDRFVAATRKWLDTRGGGGPFPGAESQPPMSQEQMIDRYSQHTRDCPACSGALRNSRALRVTAGGASIACLGAAIANASITAGRSLAPIWLSAAAAALAAVAVVAHNTAQRLVFTGYHHYEHD